MRRFLFLFFLLIVTTTFGQVGVKMSLDTVAILIGEQVQLKTSVSVPVGKKVTYPPIEERGIIMPGVEVVAVGKIDTATISDGKRWELTRFYTITSFDSALYALPPFTIEVDGKGYVSNEKIGLRVSSVPVDTTNLEKFDGLRPPVEGDFRLNWWLVLAVMCLLVGGFALYYVIHRLRSKEIVSQKVIVTHKLPAHQVALTKIEAFKQQRPEKIEEQQNYYDALTTVLRNYIEERFGLHTNEMTSSEIIAAVTHSNDATALRELKEILDTADLVKFAKFQTSLGDQNRNIMQAIDYVQLTKVATDTLIEEKTIVKLPNKKMVRRRRGYQALLCFLILQGLATIGYLLKEIYEIFF